MFAINQVYNINGDNELIFECSYTSTPSNSYTVTLTTDPVSFPNFAWMKYNFGYQSNSGSSVSAVQWTSAQLNAGQTHTYGPFNASAGGSIAIEYIEWFPDYLDQQCFFKDQNGVVYQNLVFHNLNQDKHLVAYCGTSVTPAPTVSGVKVTYIGAQPNSLQGKGVISNNPVNAISTIAQGMLFDFDLGIGESHFEAAQASQFYFVHADTPAGFSCQLAAGSDPVMGQVGSTIKNVIFECN
jgi:hypothetical protein